MLIATEQKVTKTIWSSMENANTKGTFNVINNLCVNKPIACISLVLEMCGQPTACHHSYGTCQRYKRNKIP